MPSIAILKLNDVDAREHPVFRELARVKQYFEKIKEAETSGPKQRTMAIDKGAASRFIKHALVSVLPLLPVPSASSDIPPTER